MTYITLVCASGMSTSMMMSKMRKSAEAKGIEVDIEAMSEAHFRKSDRKTDILLLGPQVSYMLDDLKNEYGPKGVKVAVISMADYGMMNGEKVLDNALALLD